MEINIVHPEPVIPPIEVVLRLTEDEAKALGDLVGYLSYNQIEEVLGVKPPSEKNHIRIQRIKDLTTEIYSLLKEKGLI